MRLADFILANVEPILAEWEAFARSIWPGAPADVVELRDHAADILRAAARDMKCDQTAAERDDKSKGEGGTGHASARVDGASDVHAIGRVRSGFDLLSLVAEYRALRASVIRLWRDSRPASDGRDLDDLTRFNEAVDQSLAEAVRSFTERVERSRQMFLAILGHDLRNPLNALTLSAEALADARCLDESAGELTGQIRASAGAMTQMVGDLLDFTSTGLGVGLRVTLSPMDLRALGQDVVDEMRAAHPGRSVRFEAHGNLSGRWDAARLRQVLSNLLGNALQHGGATGAVELRMVGEENEAAIAVHNDGPPIAAADLPTLFDPLVRGVGVEQRARRRPGSIGLGLYIAREVVAAHGGVIDVQSSIEAGTVFTVRLPHPRVGRPA